MQLPKQIHILPILLLAILMGRGFIHRVAAQNKQARIPITNPNDTIIIDSLVIIPHSLYLLHNNDTTHISTNGNLLRFNPEFNSLILNNYTPDTLILHYKTLPTKHTKSLQTYSPPPRDKQDWFPLSEQKEKTVLIGFNSAQDNYELNQSGYLKRAITVGNNQDAALNSDMNLNISGKINSGTTLTATISDKTIPIQPDGNTQSIREIDNMTLAVENENIKLYGGDFTLSNPALHLNKDIRGIGFGYADSLQEYQLSLATTTSLYHLNEFTGIEGNQGPYKLNGKAGELFIMVVAASERVYLNGELLTRGREHDYTIDYNQAEITFTHRRFVTRNYRIKVEFEYVVRNLNRYIVGQSAQKTWGRHQIALHHYSEWDALDASITDLYTPHELAILAQAGNNPEQMYADAATKVTTDGKSMLYQQTDTTVNGQNYRIYKTVEQIVDSAWQVGFSYVGNNAGHYVLQADNANGRVFSWIAPHNGTPQGNYSPRKRLIAPQSTHLGLLNYRYASKNWLLKTTLAANQNNANRLSGQGQGEEGAYYQMIELNHSTLKPDSSLQNLLQLKAHFRQARFDFPERLHPVEFSRKWNLPQEAAPADELMLSANWQYYGNDSSNMNLRSEFLSYTPIFRGAGQYFSYTKNRKDYQLQMTGNYVVSQHKDSIYQRFNGKQMAQTRNKKLLWTMVLEEELANDAAQNLQAETNFLQIQNRLQLTDTTFGPALYFINRIQGNKLNHVQGRQSIHEIGLELAESQMGQHRFSAKTGSRLQWTDSSTNHLQNYLLAHISHQYKSKQEQVFNNTQIEFNSGRQAMPQYIYAKVADGQGTHTWQDYNNNQKAEIDEFEPANFSDEANYMRVALPTHEYRKVFVSRFVQNLQLKSKTHKWQKNNRQQSFRTSYLLGIHHAGKFTQSPLQHPELLLNGTQQQAQQIQLQNSTVQTIKLHLNRWRLESSSQIQEQATEQIQGFDSKQTFKQATGVYLNPAFGQTVAIAHEYEAPQQKSGYALHRNWEFWQNKFIAEFHFVGQMLNHSTIVSYLVARDESDNLFFRQFSAIVRQNSQSDAEQLFTSDLSYIYNDFTDGQNSSLAYHLLQGLQNGHNLVWTLNIDKKLSDDWLINVSYTARYNTQGHVIHNGNIGLKLLLNENTP